MSRTRVLVVVGSMLLAVPVGAWGATIHVPGDQPTIQQGLDAAGTDDLVLVAPGTYTGQLNRNLDFAGKSVTLRSESGHWVTIIDCEGADRAFLFDSGEDTTSVVEDFTIQNAAADTGAGALFRSGSSATFTQCIFRSNTAAVYGGAAYCRASSPVFWYCLFEENVAASRANSYGGAVACTQGAHPAFRGCTFTENSAATFGGAVYCNDADPVFTSCTFDANTATVNTGGAVFCSVSSAPAFSECVFMNNFAQQQGGAIQTQNSSPTLTDCAFYDNTAGTGLSGMGGALSLHYTSAGQFSGCTFMGNYANAGAAVECFDHADATFTNCTLVANEGRSGVGAYLQSASPAFENTIIAFSVGTGAAASCDSTSSPSFSKCVLYANAGGDDLCGAVSDTLHRDPLFCHMVDAELDLCENSACAPDNNAWGELIGAWDVGCPTCSSPVEPATWGAIKALYR